MWWAEFQLIKCQHEDFFISNWVTTLLHGNKDPPQKDNALLPSSGEDLLQHSNKLISLTVSLKPFKWEVPFWIHNSSMTSIIKDYGSSTLHWRVHDCIFHFGSIKTSSHTIDKKGKLNSCWWWILGNYWENCIKEASFVSNDIRSYTHTEIPPW